jgi:hypothetical protein
MSLSKKARRNINLFNAARAHSEEYMKPRLDEFEKAERLDKKLTAERLRIRKLQEKIEAHKKAKEQQNG